jgi:hypothetical protein
MKQPFRFFRGEFNGFFLYRLVTFLNHAVKDILDELVYQATSQWKTEEALQPGETAMRDGDIINIGKVAGVFQAFGEFETNIGSVNFTPSHVVDGQERNERALMDMDREVFEYVRVEADDYPDDILNEATARKRISVVPPGTKPVGYVAMGTPLFNKDGTVIWENLLPEPPDDTAYVPFFGERFLILEEQFILETTLTVPILKLLIECLLRVRYQGPSIALFLEITRILGEGYIYDIEILPRQLVEPDGRATVYYEVRHKRDTDSAIDNHLRRYAVWQIVCKQKFKMFKPVEAQPVEGD